MYNFVNFIKRLSLGLMILLIGSCQTKTSSKETELNPKIGTREGTYIQGDGSVNLKLVDEFVGIIKTNWYKRDTVNWNTFKKNIIIKLKASKYHNKYDKVFSETLKILEPHSKYFKSKPSKIKSIKRISVVRYPTLFLLDSNILWIKIPSILWKSEKLNHRMYAKIGQNLICKTKKSSSTWVIDLIGNGGGEIWPMILAIAPLLDKGNIGSFSSLKGKDCPVSKCPKHEWPCNCWMNKNKWVGSGAHQMDHLSIQKPCKHLKSQKIFILTDSSTLSAAEAVVVAFKGQKNVYHIGQPTGGLSSANSRHSLSNGANVVIPGSVFADCNGKLYGGKIKPDITISEEILNNDRLLYKTILELAD